VTYMATKRVLLDALDRESGASAPAARRATTTAAPLLNRAQESGGANPDLNIDDVMRFVIGVTSSPFGSDPATRTNPRMAISGIAVRPATRGRTSPKSQTARPAASHGADRRPAARDWPIDASCIMVLPRPPIC
jgi:hypothetical protein